MVEARNREGGQAAEEVEEEEDMQVRKRAMVEGDSVGGKGAREGRGRGMKTPGHGKANMPCTAPGVVHASVRDTRARKDRKGKGDKCAYYGPEKGLGTRACGRKTRA